MGQYVPSNGSVRNKLSGEGSWNNLTGQSECLSASPGYYVPSEGSTIQYPCQNGTYNPWEINRLASKHRPVIM